LERTPGKLGVQLASVIMPLRICMYPDFGVGSDNRGNEYRNVKS